MTRPDDENAPHAMPLDYGRSASQYAADSDYIPPCPGNPFVTIFTQPKETLRWIIGAEPMLHVIKIVAISGTMSAIEFAFDRENEFDFGGVALALLIGIPVGILISLVAFYLYGWLTGVVGRWFGGTGTSERCRAAVVWGGIPSLACSIALTPAFIALWAFPLAQLPAALAALALALVALGVGIYALVLMSIGVGIAHRFNAWLGFAALLLASVFILLPIIAVLVPIVILTQ